MCSESCYIKLLLNLSRIRFTKRPERQEGEVSRTQCSLALSGSAVSCIVNNMSYPNANPY